DYVRGSLGGWQCFINRIFHHGAGCIVAVMAAKAGQQSVHIWSSSSHTDRQNFGVPSRTVRASNDDGLVEQSAYVLAPQNRGAARQIAGFVSAVTHCAVVRCVAACAATAIVKVCAQYVGRRYEILGSYERRCGQDDQHN